MGINIVMYFLTEGESPQLEVVQRIRSSGSNIEEKKDRWRQMEQKPSDLLQSVPEWATPDGWEDLIPATAEIKDDTLLAVFFLAAQCFHDGPPNRV